jgi:ATP-dependent Lhr-like helicase
MIVNQKEPFTKEESLLSLNVYIREWFVGKYRELTPPQYFSFKLISQKKNLLITAPTGSGKTFSAFASILSNLISLAEAGKLEDKVYCIYISPLKALNNDIYRNLMEPMEEIYKNIKDSKRISVGIRTGDTPQSDRQKQLRKPPNILITTPESLAILLNSERFLEGMRDVNYLVIDELHELASNKRGVHLSLSLERLRCIVNHDFVRIGLSATMHPLEDAARFLVGYERGNERDCTIVDASWDKKLKYLVISPVSDIVNAKDSSIDRAIYKTLDAIIKKNKTTLIFTNTRSGTERVTFNLVNKMKYGEESVAAHHGSLSREERLGVEETLKKGNYRCVVSSTSLELGIDIGTIDNVVLLGSPKSVTRAIQRIGRSGHSFMDVAEGEVIALNRDDLVECSVMLDSARRRHLDSFTTPKNALDVLAQHVVGMALNKVWDVDEAYALVKGAYPYHNLSMDDFMSVIEYLAGSYAGLENRKVYGKIWYEREARRFGKMGRLTRLIYYLNLGTIPDQVAVEVYTADRKKIGSIEEEFLSRLKEGDIFTLGGKVYEFKGAKGMICIVSRADGKHPTIPPWFSEQLPLSYELAIDIGRFRKSMSQMLKGISRKILLQSLSSKGNAKTKALLAMVKSLPVDDNAASAISKYMIEQYLFAGVVPDNELILIERTTTEDNRIMLVFNSLFGRRINDALSRVFAITISEMYGVDVGLMVNDNGFSISTDEDVIKTESEVELVMRNVLDSDVESLLRSNIRKTEMMKRRFRHCAARGLMILRNYKGVKISVRKQQFNAESLISAAESIRNFPIIKETYREILEDVMDLPRAKLVLAAIKNAEIGYKFIATKVPSPFSHMMVTLGESDVILMKDRHAHIRKLHRMVIKEIREGRMR